jgi:glycosyltransferase 2 family protein
VRRAVAVLRVVGLVLLCGWFVSRLDVGAVGVALSSPGWVLAAALFYGAGHLANAEAWRGLVNAGGARVGRGDAVLHELGSQFWGTVLPGGVSGEVVKGVRIARDGAGGQAVAVALVASRVVSGVTTCALGLSIVPLSRFPERPALAGALAICAIGGVVLLAALRFGPDLPLLRRLPRGPTPDGRALASAAVTSAIARLSYGGMFFCVFAAAGAPLGFVDATVLSSLAALTQLLPLTLGGYGVRELTIGSLGSLLVPRASADAAALLLLVLVTATVLLGGATEATRARRAATRA